MRALLKRTEAELSMRVSEAARRQEDPLQRQRTLVEEEVDMRLILLDLGACKGSHH